MRELGLLIASHCQCGRDMNSEVSIVQVYLGLRTFELDQHAKYSALQSQLFPFETNDSTSDKRW